MTGMTRRGDGAAAAPSLPWWQTTPCPAWCATSHADVDPPADRIHRGGWRTTVLTSMPVDPADPRPSGVTVSLTAHVREIEPRIVLRDSGDWVELVATLAEARKVIGDVASLVVDATDPLLPPRPGPGCRPWCVSPGMPGQTGHVCRTSATAVPGGTVHTADYTADGGGTVIHLDAPTDELTPDAAEAVALALLAQVSAVRTREAEQ